MLNLLMFFIGITAIFLIARYNKSNQLFWILLLAMLSGFVGGTVAANIGNDKQDNITIITQNDGFQGVNMTIFNPFVDLEDPSNIILNNECSVYDMSDVMLPTDPSRSGICMPSQQSDYVDTS